MCRDHVRGAARPVYVRSENTITFLHTMLQYVVGGTKYVPNNIKGNYLACETWLAGCISLQLKLQENGPPPVLAE